MLSGPFPPTLFPSFSPLFPLQALFALLRLLPSSPPPLHPLSDLGTPLILVLFSVLLSSDNLPSPFFARHCKRKFLSSYGETPSIPLPKTLPSQSWRPATEVPKPRPDKSAEKVLRKVPDPNGVPRKVPKKCFGLRASVEAVMRLEGRSTFSALSSAPPGRLGPALSEALFRHFCRDGASALLWLVARIVALPCKFPFQP